MNDLSGSSMHPMDDKGRVSLPAKFRNLLPDDLVIVRSANKDFASLRIYTPEGYKEWIDMIFVGKGGYKANSASMDFLKTKMYGMREKITVNQAGRILIPQSLREYASLGKMVMIIGAEDRIEIWNEDIYKQAEAFYEDKIEIFDE